MQQYDDDHLVDGRRSIGSVTPPRRTCPAAGRAPDWLKHVDGRRRHPQHGVAGATPTNPKRFVMPHLAGISVPIISPERTSFSGRRRRRLFAVTL